MPLVTQRWRSVGGKEEVEKAERGGGASGMGGAATTSAKGCSHSHTAICTHKVGQRGGEKQTRSGGGHQRCPNYTPSRPHVNQQRGAGSGTRASSSPSSLSTAREHTSSLPHPHPTAIHAIISIDLAYNHHHTATAPLTQPTSPHIHSPTHPHARASVQRERSTTTSSTCPSPPACHTCKHKQQVVHV